MSIRKGMTEMRPSTKIGIRMVEEYDAIEDPFWVT
jgi:hypothetical protein